jgi:hypothetical protein
MAPGLDLQVAGMAFIVQNCRRNSTLSFDPVYTFSIIEKTGRNFTVVAGFATLSVRIDYAVDFS